MQGEASNGSKTQWLPHYEPQWNNGQVAEDGVTLSRPSASSANKDGAVVAVVSETAAETPVAPNIDYHDDEMVSWLQYPLDDSLERNYYSDFFGELPSSNMQVVKGSFVGQGAGRLQHLPVASNMGTDSVVNKTANVAMTLGAGRAAGVIPQAGAEAFSKVRTLQPLTSKWQPFSLTPNSSKGFCVYPSASQALLGASPNASRPLPAPRAPLKPQPRPGTHNLQAESVRKLAPVNFSHFSRSATIMKKYQGVGVVSDTPSNILDKQKLVKANIDTTTSTGSLIAESTTMGRSGIGSQKVTEIHLQGSGSQQQEPGVDAGRVVPIPITRKEVESPLLEGEAVLCKTKPAEEDTLRLSSVTCIDVLESADKGLSQGKKLPDAQEPAITSPSGGSGNSAERVKEASTSNKRKAVVTEETEYQSEDGEDESADLKKRPEGRTSTTKRTRAAEVHNLSERRRRDRINEKMKALQELIPNSNKTDKASMLDEAIEYLKMLQLQLQMMSMRTGMSISAMGMPSGMQHLQIPQMAGIPPLGMGMGMGMGMGVGMGMRMMDMAASGSGQGGMPLPSHAGTSHSANIPVTSVNIVDVHNPRFHNPNVMEASQAYQQQPLQIPQPMNMDMYNAYMLQQHQNQQQQHHQYQSPNMGGGPPQ